MPENDECENAIPLSPYECVMGDTSFATLDVAPTCLDFLPEFAPDVPVVAPGIWYKVLGTGNYMYATTCPGADANAWSQYDNSISVYCPDCDLGSCAVANQDWCYTMFGSTTFEAHVDWCTEPDMDYLILVHGYSSSSTGAFNLCVAENGPCDDPPDCGGAPPEPPPNDDCDDAESVPAPGQTFGSTALATGDCPGIFFFRNVWFKIQGTGNVITVETCQTDWDTWLDVYCPGCCPPADFSTLIMSNDDAECDGVFTLQSRVEWCSHPDVEYLVMLDSAYGGSGDYILDVFDGEPCECQGIECCGAQVDCVDCDDCNPPDGEGENCPNSPHDPCGIPDDTYNGGCNSTPAVFSQTQCSYDPDNPTTICGSGAVDTQADPAIRDTDWYEFTVDTQTEVTVTGLANMRFQMLILEGPCDDITVLTFDQVEYCEDASMTITLDPGTYWLWAGPWGWEQDEECPTLYEMEMSCVDLNEPPVCDANGPYNLECGGVTQLDGTGSMDPNGDPLTYMWSTTCTGGDFDDPTSATPTFTAGNTCFEQCLVELCVSDGFADPVCCAAPMTIEDTLPPEAECSVEPVGFCAAPLGCEGVQGVVNLSCTDQCDDDPMSMATLNGEVVYDGDIFFVIGQGEDECVDIPPDPDEGCDAWQFCLPLHLEYTCTDDCGLSDLCTDDIVCEEDESAD